MKQHYLTAIKLSSCMRLIKKWNTLFVKVKQTASLKNLNKLNNLSLLLGVKRRIALTALAGVVTLGVQGQSLNLYDIDVGEQSALTFEDLDADGDLDLISGEKAGKIKYYQNDGNYIFIEQTGTDNPFSGFFDAANPTPTFEDLDGDGDLDLIYGLYTGTINYSKNDGNNVFTKQTGINNPFSGIDLGINSMPTFKDLDGDGDLDLIAGAGDGTIYYFKNNGENVFTEQADSNNPFNGIDVGATSTPTFEDLDADGDLDLICGEYNGKLNYFLNYGNANFIEQRLTTNLFNGIDVGFYSTPTFEDIDGDGNLDLLCGEYNGTINYYKNDGNNVFIEQIHLFDGIHVGNNSTPVFEDFDKDGDLDIISGEFHGTINYYKNDGENIFKEQTGFVSNPFNGIDVGLLSTPVFEDLDGDGDIDVISGEGDGTIKYYKNDGENVFTEQTGVNNLFDEIDLGSSSVPVFEDLDGDGDIDLILGEREGTIKYYKNAGENVFTEQTGTNNPFDGIDVGLHSAPNFADLDDDGDLDLISGAEDGTIYYYKNAGENTFIEQTGTNNPFDGIDIGLHSTPVLEDIDGDGYFELYTGDYDGNIKQIIFDLSKVTGIISQNGIGSLEIFPNPASSIIHTEEGPLEIIDALGNHVLNIESTGIVDISNLETGIYFVSQNEKRTKLVIE